MQPCTPSQPPPPLRLSARQRECLAWVCAGKSSTDIGAILGLSARTVDDYVAAACQRMGVRTRLQAALCARELGLLGGPLIV